MKTIFYLVASIFLLGTVVPLNARNDFIKNKTAPNQITYHATGSFQPIAGSSTFLKGTLQYNDTTGAVQAFAFNVPLYSFNDDYPSGATNSFIAWLGAANFFPEMSFQSSKIKQDGDHLIIQGQLYYRGKYSPVTIHATRDTRENDIQLLGEFTMDTHDYLPLFVPAYLVPSNISFSFEANFDKPQAS